MVIVVEGKSDKTFLKALLTFLEIEFNDNNFVVMTNKSNLLNSSHQKYITLQKSIDSGKISSNILFLVDADYVETGSGYIKTEKDITQTISSLNFTSFADYLVMCAPIRREGYLESLILSTLSNEEEECIKKALECAEIEKQHDKDIFNKVYKYYYPNRAINFKHKNFKPLIAKINKLFDKVD